MSRAKPQAVPAVRTPSGAPLTPSRAHFPPLLNEIVDVAGYDAALKLTAARGGARVHIPGRAPDGHWLVELVGRVAADALCAHFRTRDGGAFIKLPLGPKAFYAVQRMRAIAMIEAGKSENEIILALGVSRSFVGKLRAERRDDRQGRLF